MKALKFKTNSSTIFRILAILAFVVNLIILFYNAGTLNVWDDEVNTYFLARQPLNVLLNLMSNNIHEDPPLFDLLLHFWIDISGENTLVLRTLSILFWAFAVGGVYFAGKQLNGPKTGCVMTIFLTMMPYHWLFPAAIKWYSLFACLAVWNFFFFLRLCPVQKETINTISSFKYADLCFYIISGTGLWYTNYFAPVLFFSQLIVVLLWAKHRVKYLKILVPAWCAIGLCYLPWLSVFFNQLNGSVKSFSVVDTVVSLYALCAGEFCFPFDYWKSLPYGIFLLLLTCLLILKFKQCRIPLTFFVIVLAIFVYSGVIGSKRLLIISPFAAICYGVILTGSVSRHRLLQKGLTYLAVLVYIIALAGSCHNMITRGGWLSYRWLDPFENVVSHVQKHHPNALILTNSNSIFFYLNDEIGAQRFWSKWEKLPCYLTEGHSAKAFIFPANSLHPSDKLLQEKLATAGDAIYIHTGAQGPFSCVQPVVEKYLQERGYKVRKTDSFLKMNQKYIDFHHKYRDENANKQFDSNRIVAAYFSKNESNN